MAARALLLLLLVTAALAQSPPTFILWAWDRAEDLRFLRPGEAEAAILVRTIYIRDGKATPWHRKLPAFVPDGIRVIEVTRLESDGTPLPDPERVREHLNLYPAIARGPAQIDFDARASQLDWYKQLLTLRPGPAMSIQSITALASWCMEPPWFAGLVAEAVPMLFRMGPQRASLLDRLRIQGQFADGCRNALGLATDEPLPWRPAARRIYLFSPTPWTRESFDKARASLR